MLFSASKTGLLCKWFEQLWQNHHHHHHPTHNRPVPAHASPHPSPTGGTMWIIKNSGPFLVGSRRWLSVSQLRLYWNPTQLQRTVALLRGDAAAAQRHFCLPGSRQSLLHHGRDSYILFFGLTETIHPSAWNSLVMRACRMKPPPHEIWRAHSIRQV